MGIGNAQFWIGPAEVVHHDIDARAQQGADDLRQPVGFDMDFEKAAVETTRVTSLQAARAALNAAFERATEAFGRLSDEELSRKLPPNPIMGEVPLTAVISALVDHTAHHRGALTVYARLRGKVPAMPYMEMEEAPVTV